MPHRTNPIHADRYWNDTGVDLTKGVRYRFRVVPGMGETLQDASFVARSIEGEDWQSLAHRTAEGLDAKRVDDAKWFALIGTIEKDHPWIITDGGEHTAPADGRLFCFFNDVQVKLFYKNNKGWVVLDVEDVQT